MIFNTISEQDVPAQDIEQVIEEADYYQQHPQPVVRFFDPNIQEELDQREQESTLRKREPKFSSLES